KGFAMGPGTRERVSNSHSEYFRGRRFRRELSDEFPLTNCREMFAFRFDRSLRGRKCGTDAGPSGFAAGERAVLHRCWRIGRSELTRPRATRHVPFVVWPYD